ncbi:hypothetical protein ACQEVM_37825 [Streptomyces sp. CA-243310]|uniref:hypothetical protein n=1 Tax=Streptomyces sp. CA-243310 TaxID=3240056 RepID=UPI003D94754F
MREEAGDREGAEALCHQAADQGNTHALFSLAVVRERAGDREGAEALYRQAADQGNTHALHRLAVMREEAGDREGAEALYRRVTDCGFRKEEFGKSPGSLGIEGLWPYGLDPDGRPTPPWQ